VIGRGKGISLRADSAAVREKFVEFVIEPDFGSIGAVSNKVFLPHCLAPFNGRDGHLTILKSALPSEQPFKDSRRCNRPVYGGPENL